MTFMSRNARIVINYFEYLTKSVHTAADVLKAELLVYRYYTPPMVSRMKEFFYKAKDKEGALKFDFYYIPFSRGCTGGIKPGINKDRDLQWTLTSAKAYSSMMGNLESDWPNSTMDLAEFIDLADKHASLIMASAIKAKVSAVNYTMAIVRDELAKKKFHDDKMEKAERVHVNIKEEKLEDVQVRHDDWLNKLENAKIDRLLSS